MTVDLCFIVNVLIAITSVFFVCMGAQASQPYNPMYIIIMIIIMHAWKQF